MWKLVVLEVLDGQAPCLLPWLSWQELHLTRLWLGYVRTMIDEQWRTGDSSNGCFGLLMKLNGAEIGLAESLWKIVV